MLSKIGDSNTRLPHSFSRFQKIPDFVDLCDTWWGMGDQGSTGSCVGWAKADSVLRWHFINFTRFEGGFAAIIFETNNKLMRCFCSHGYSPLIRFTLMSRLAFTDCAVKPPAHCIGDTPSWRYGASVKRGLDFVLLEMLLDYDCAKSERSCSLKIFNIPEREISYLLWNHTASVKDRRSLPASLHTCAVRDLLGKSCRCRVAKRC
jgi:hypothetical protein